MVVGPVYPNKSIDDFREDALLRSAVERQFIIIGEALQQALKLDDTLPNSISDCRRIVNFRNVIVHGYAHVMPDTVWGVITIHLPKLREEIALLMSRESH